MSLTGAIPLSTGSGSSPSTTGLSACATATIPAENAAMSSMVETANLKKREILIGSFLYYTIHR
jgi:hypothetical protein